MTRIALFFVTTVAILVLLFSYKTSGPGPSLGASPLGGAARVVSGPAVVSGAPPTSAPSPVPATAQSSAAAATTPGTTGPSRTAPSRSRAPRTTAASRTSASTTKASPTQNVAPVVVDGAAVDTNYGPVQVQVTITQKKITAVTVPVYPSGSGRDMEINSYALPQLVAEVLSAQSATIDAVSGATYTSQGFQASLQSALDAAKFGR